MGLENELFGDCDEGVLGPYYVRLCCDFFADTCFMVFADDKPAGYLLAFAKGREAYCTTLAMMPAYHGSRALLALIRAFVSAIADRVDRVWFTVEEDNAPARALHRMLGAREVEVREDFYGPGRPRIISQIDEDSLEAARQRFERLGLLEGSRRARPERAVANA